MTNLVIGSTEVIISTLKEKKDDPGRKAKGERGYIHLPSRAPNGHESHPKPTPKVF